MNNNTKQKPDTLGQKISNFFAKFILISILFILIFIIPFFPLNKLEYDTPDGEKIVVCYNSISKICITMELEENYEIKNGEIIKLYEVKRKGAGHINIYKKQSGEKIIYMYYGANSISISSKSTNKNSDISIFSVVWNYLFNVDQFSAKNVSEH